MFKTKIINQGIDLGLGTRPSCDQFETPSGVQVPFELITGRLAAVMSDDRLGVSDCDETLTGTDVGEEQMARHLKNPAHYPIADPQKLAEVLTPDWFCKAVSQLDPCQYTASLAADLQAVLDVYMAVRTYGATKTDDFIKVWDKFSATCFELEKLLRDSNIDLKHPDGHKTPLLIRVRIFAGLDRDTLDRSFANLFAPFAVDPTRALIQPTAIFRACLEAEVQPIIATTNLEDLIKANLAGFADVIEGSEYAFNQGIFTGFPAAEPCFLESKISRALTSQNVSVDLADEAIAFMAGDSSNDVPTMLAALRGRVGFVLVRIKTPPSGFEAARNKWNAVFQNNNIPDQVIANNVYYLREGAQPATHRRFK